MLADKLSPAYAAAIAPAKIITCPGVTEEEVRELLAKGLEVARLVEPRLVRFDQAADDARRADIWNTGPEGYWFAAYDRLKLFSLRRVFARIPDILSSKRLDIICHHVPGFSYGDADPGIWKINLGMDWVNDSGDREERIQTFVHEAAHIVGRWVVNEDPWYGREDAHNMAHIRRPGRCRMAMRSADNIGYYAIDIAENGVMYKMLASA
jgi:hypothetical protein